MSALSNAYEAGVLDHILGTSALTSPTTVYVGLFKSTVDAATTLVNLEAGTLTDEVATAGGTAYARRPVTFGAASVGAGTASNDADVTFATATANWGEVTIISVLDNSGVPIVSGILDTAKTIESGDSFVITVGNLTITLA
tara:strand:+ start:679 stop:1101 length:423 start_codon:yes stop_codon:yes gene_type:complete